MKLIIFLSLVASTLAASEVFTRQPGSTSALRDGHLSLAWETTLNTDDIFFCYWDYISKKTGRDQFLGYGNDKSYNNSQRRKGWRFMNKGSPCKGGIWRNQLEDDQAGIYELTIEDRFGNTYKSDPVTVKIYEEAAIDDLQLDVTNTEKMVNVSLRMASDDHEIVLDTLVGERGVAYKLIVDLDDNFPPETEIVLVKKVDGEEDFRVSQCSKAAFRACEVDIYLGMENRVSIVAEVDTKIQGYPVISIVQPFDYIGMLPFILAIVVGLVIALLCVGLIFGLVIMCRKLRDSRTLYAHDKEENKDQMERNAKLSRQIEQEKEAFQAKENELAHLKDECEDLKSQLREAADDKESMADKAGYLSTLESEVAELRKQLQEESNTVVSKDNKLRDLQHSMSNQEGECEVLKEAKANVEKDLKAAKNELTQVQNEKAVLEEHYGAAQGEIARLGDIIQQLQADAQSNIPQPAGDAPQIVSGFQEVDRMTREPLSLSVTAAGPGPLSARWYRNSQVIHDSVNIQQLESDNMFTLNFKSIMLSQGGTYRCVVSNEEGEVEHAAKVNVFS